MRKGMSGKVLTVVITLIIAILALILLWLFLDKLTPILSDFVQKIIGGITCDIIGRIFGPLRMAWGC